MIHANVYTCVCTVYNLKSPKYMNIKKIKKEKKRKCSVSLVIRETQIKITLKCHLTPNKMAKFTNTDDNLC